MSIFADGGLADEFEVAANDPQGTDFAFLKAREASGFANFGFDPERAAELRQAELERIEAAEAAKMEIVDDDSYSPWSREEQADFDRMTRSVEPEGY